MISKPTQLPEVRASVAEWTATNGPWVYEEFLRAGIMGWNGSFKAGADTARKLAAQEVYRLAKAELYWVDAKMTDLVSVACRSIPSFTLQPEDLPSPYGLIVFERPLRINESPDGFDDKTYVTAAAWGDGTVAGAPHPGTWVSWYTDTAANFENYDPRRPHADRGWRQLGLPPLSYENESYLTYSKHPLPVIQGGETVELAAASEHYPTAELVAAWTLMRQPIAAIEDAHFDRAARRRLQRQRIEPKPVRVITLRRSKSSSEHTESDREYHHKWIVRGHWRQQWYPARQVHRPVWIAPHIKGPEDAPLLGGEKVHAWRR